MPPVFFMKSVFEEAYYYRTGAQVRADDTAHGGVAHLIQIPLRC